MMYQNVNDGKTPPGVPAKPSRHWSQRIQETVVSFGSEGLFHLSIRGGADIGQFPWIHDIKHNKVQYHSGRLYADDIVLEIQGQKVAGYTLRDTIDWLNQISRNGTPVMFKTVKTGHLPKDLKQYLNTRFQKSSCDHDLQQIIRDNLYLRTVPCTTRAPRPGELNGVDYTFLTAAEFFKLEANGSLLESGLFEDNHYGTPKPPKDPAQPSLFRRTNSTGTLLPGHHPSSEGKRRRNRSNIETVSATAAAVAAAAANKARTGGSPALMGKQRSLSGSSSAPPPLYRKPSMERVHGGNKIEGNNNDELGEMPPNWERDFTDDGTPYYIDHSTETTHWLDPRIALMKKKDIKECNLDGGTPIKVATPSDKSSPPASFPKTSTPSRVSSTHPAAVTVPATVPSTGDNMSATTSEDKDDSNNSNSNRLVSVQHALNLSTESDSTLKNLDVTLSSSFSSDSERIISEIAAIGLGSPAPSGNGSSCEGMPGSRTAGPHEKSLQRTCHVDAFSTFRAPMLKYYSPGDEMSIPAMPLLAPRSSTLETPTRKPLKVPPAVPPRSSSYRIPPSAGLLGAMVPGSRNSVAVPNRSGVAGGSMYQHNNWRVEDRRRFSLTALSDTELNRYAARTNTIDDINYRYGRPQLKYDNSAGLGLPGDHEFASLPRDAGSSRSLVCQCDAYGTQGSCECRDVVCGLRRGKTLHGYGDTCSRHNPRSSGRSTRGSKRGHRRLKNVKFIQSPELPYGWEKVEDEHYGTYYIDHVNRKTQYENPVKAAKDQLNISGGSASRTQSLSQADMNGVRPPPVYSTKKPYFTRDPEKLRGKFLRTSLKKSSRGLGFTIVGGDYGDEEFLQIKNVVPQGPAYLDGVLKTGDVLVYINGMPVLGCIHQDVVEIFQAMPADSMVELEVCRGYPLPFDPDDPDTEIVTTVAVSLPDSEKAGYTVTPPKGSNNSNKPVNTRSINSNSYNNTEEDYTDSVQNGGLSGGLNGGMNGDGLTLSVEIVKGPHGFGFTIFDTAIGQCVKQVMDHERCKELQEGDLLLSIDKKSLSHSTHNQVVQALQDCKHGTASLITVQRTGLPRSKLKKSGSSNLNNLKREDRAGSIDGNSQQNSNNSAYYGQNSDLLNDSHDSIGFTQDHHSGHGSEPSTTPVLPRRTQSTHEHGYKHDSLKDMHQAHHRGYQNGGPLYANDPHRQDPRGYDMDINDVRFRSRTPGPEFMRGNSDDMFSKSQQQVTRSKTPTNDGFLYGQQHSQYHNGPRSAGGNFGNNATAISGTPDFIPASRYTSPPSPRGNGTILYRHQNHDRGKARPLSSGPDLASNGSGVGSGMNSSHTYSGALNYATQNQRTAQPEGVSPSSSGGSSVQNPHTNNPTHSRRQHATSFEHETPSSALQHNSTWQNDVLNRSRSPGLNSAGSTGGYPDTTDERYVELTVFLKKHENGFGFRIIGGTEEGSQVSVGHIVPGGPADKDGRLRMGDEIIYVDGKNVLGYLHRQVVQVIGESSKAGRVSLGVRRKITHSTQTNDSSPYHNTDQTQFPYEVTVTRRRDEGFGFVIISSVTRAGSTIGRILPDSPAERCGLLRLGDRILEVDGVDIGKLHHEEIVTLIKDSGFSVTLLIGQPIDDLGTTPSMSQRSPSDNSTDPGVTVPHSGIPQTSAPQAATPQPDGPATVSSQGSMLNSLSTYTSREDASRRTEYSPYNSSHTTPTTAPTTAQNRYGNAPSGHQDLEDPTQSNATLAGYRQSPHVLDTYSKVDLHRGSRGFGFSIRGGQEFNSMPLYVLRIADGGAADLDQRLQVGDQIIEINGYNTNHMTHGEAINLIQTGGSTVHLLIKRTGKPPPHIGTTSESSNSTPLNNHITVNTKSSHVPKSRQTTHTPLSSNHSAFSNGPIGQSSPNLMNNARSAGYNVPQSRSGGDRPGGVHNRQHSNTGYH